MSHLNQTEILALLETMDPDEIETARREQLDNSGKRFLAEIRQNIRTGESMFSDYGRRFRSHDQVHSVRPTPTATADKVSTLEWLLRSIRVPYWALGMVAGLVGITLTLRLLELDTPNRTRGHNINLESIEPINKELVEVLMKRGNALMSGGNQKQNRAFYQESRDDLMQAYELDPKNINLLGSLAIIHEKLGEDRKAKRFLAERKTLQEAEVGLEGP